ncbi:MAG: hypothetical protein ACREKS_06805 [Candidatus Rokuibacteriota bacterium]
MTMTPEVISFTGTERTIAISELVVNSSHSVQGHPQAIEEIRRILLEHAAAPSGSRQ